MSERRGANGQHGVPSATGSVLVVGAGPVGLVLACELARQGVAVRVVCRPRRENLHSRATILWPRILELLDRVGAGAELVAAGHYFDQMNYYSEKRRIGRIRFDRLQGVTYPFAVTIPQWRTEQMLEARFTALGGTIDEGVEFVDGVDEGDGVRCRLRRPDGTVREEHHAWLVGADGFASTVRDRFGFSYAGRALRTRLAITDAEIVGEVTSSEAAYYLTRRGNMVLAPLGAGVFRVGASVPHDHVGDEVDRDFFERLLADRVPGRRRLGDMRFTGVFTANIRSADRFRAGRVFLVGDAAHVMSPSGAQGLNTGIQDAVNLGWRLGGVASDRLDPTALDGYDPERRAAAERVSRLSTRLARISLYSARRHTAVRDLLYRAGSATGLLEAVLAPRLGQLDTSYGPVSTLVRMVPLRPGERVPVGWREAPGRPVLAVDRFTVLLWPGTTYPHDPWCRLVDAVRDHLPHVAVSDLAGRPPGSLLPRLPRRAVALVVRPDGHLHAGVDLEVAEVPAALAGLDRALPTRPLERIAR